MRDVNNTEKKERSNWIFSVVVMIVLISLMIFSVKTSILFPIKVKGHSMDNTLLTGDKYFATKMIDCDRGDIVVIESPLNEDELFIKRVIAVENDILEIKDDKVYVNGEEIEENYLDEHRESLDDGEELMKDMDKKRISEGSFYVMGDNRLNSIDSRNFGDVGENLLKGVVLKRDKK